LNQNLVHGNHALGYGPCGVPLPGAGSELERRFAGRRRQPERVLHPRADAIRFFVRDIQHRLPFENGAFDRVVNGLVLEHIEDLANFFAEINQVLKANGRAVLSAMHPAMFLRGSQPRFTDSDSGEIVQTGSDLQLLHLGEHSPRADFAARYPRCEKYVDWPMLEVLDFAK
jgi:SAM-dependent methyltransferase